MIQRRMVRGFSARYFAANAPRQRDRIALVKKELVCTIATFETCQWLGLNDPAKHSAMCGQPTLSGKPYCGAHWTRAWQPSTEVAAAAPNA